MRRFHSVLAVVILLAVVQTDRVRGQFAVSDLGPLPGWNSEESGINDNGQVVGFAATGDGDYFHAFLYSKEGCS